MCRTNSTRISPWCALRLVDRKLHEPRVAARGHEDSLLDRARRARCCVRPSSAAADAARRSDAASVAVDQRGRRLLGPGANLLAMPRRPAPAKPDAQDRQSRTTSACGFSHAIVTHTTTISTAMTIMPTRS